MQPETNVNNNIDQSTVSGFGREWSRFTQAEVDPTELRRKFDAHFSIFPWDRLPPGGGEGADIGCGSGRWAKLAAKRVARLHLVDASPAALEVAKRNLAEASNIELHCAAVDDLPFADGSLDFAYCLGVLHHVPDTLAGIAAIARKLKLGAPFLVYLYYRFDNRPIWYQMMWRLSDGLRRVVSRLPAPARFVVCEIIAGTIYWPLARSWALLNWLGLGPSNWPLKHNANVSFYGMRTDALDRFGTSLERRFTRREIKQMLEAAGFAEVRFSETPPYWCAIGFRKA